MALSNWQVEDFLWSLQISFSSACKNTLNGSSRYESESERRKRGKVQFLVDLWFRQFEWEPPMRMCPTGKQVVTAWPAFEPIELKGVMLNA